MTTRRTSRRVTAIVIIGIVAIAVSAIWVRSSVTSPVEHESAEQIITVDQGAGSQAVIARLAEAGIVRHPLALKVYLRLTGKGGNLKAGDYKFASPISPLQAIEKIRRGEVFIERVTIPEGYNRFEIAETFAAKTGKATKEEVLRLIEDQSPIRPTAPQAPHHRRYQI